MGDPDRMSIHLQTWLIQLAAAIALLSNLFVRSAWLFGLGVMLVVFAMFWPRCRRCGLPTFWRKRPADPDHFVYYIGKPPFFPGHDCSRCGEDLTT